MVIIFVLLRLICVSMFVCPFNYYRPKAYVLFLVLPYFTGMTCDCGTSWVPSFVSCADKFHLLAANFVHILTINRMSQI